MASFAPGIAGMVQETGPKLSSKDKRMTRLPRRAHTLPTAWPKHYTAKRTQLQTQRCHHIHVPQKTDVAEIMSAAAPMAAAPISPGVSSALKTAFASACL